MPPSLLGLRAKMKLVSVVVGDGHRVGMVSAEAGRVWLTENRDMVAVIAAYEETRERLQPRGAGLDLQSVQLGAPIPMPRGDMFCVGKNYRAHAREFARSGFDSTADAAPEDTPAAPIIFTKTSRAVIGQDVPIR